MDIECPKCLKEVEVDVGELFDGFEEGTEEEETECPECGSTIAIERHIDIDYSVRLISAKDTGSLCATPSCHEAKLEGEKYCYACLQESLEAAGQLRIPMEV